MGRLHWYALNDHRVSRRALMKLMAAGGSIGLVGLLAACGEDDDDDPAGATDDDELTDDESTDDESDETSEPSDDEETTSESDSEDEEEIKRGGTLRLGFYRDQILTLDPAIVNIGQFTEVTGNIFNGLVDLDPDLVVIPDLAEEWEVAEDGLSYTFQLREGVTFHNGDDFTSADVVYTFERTSDPELASPHANKLEPVESVETPDDFTVVFNMSQPYSPFLANTLSRAPGRAITIVNQTAVEEMGNEEYGILPVGTGPFRITRNDVGSTIELEAFEDYWDEGKPYLDGVEITLIPEASSAASALEAGDIDFLDVVAPQSVEQLSSNSDLVVSESPATNWNGLNMNQDREPWDNLDARMAVAKAIDRLDFIEKARFGVDVPAHGPLTPGVAWAYRESLEDNPQEFDLEAAKELAESSGVSGTTARILATGLGERNAEVLRNQLSEIGLTLELDIVQQAVWNERWIAGDYDLMVNGSVVDPDPDDSVWNFFLSDGPWNTYGYVSEEVDDLLRQQREAIDRDERVELLHQLEDILIADVPFAYIYHFLDIAAYHNSVKGFVHVPEARPLETVWLDT